MNPDAEPKLAPPGAGLPKPELFIARLIFRLRYRTGNRESFTIQFAQEREAIRRLVNSCGPPSATKRVLIKRIAGLEDSSRYWSIWMTLDHLRIVNHNIAKTIETLAKEVVPPGQTSTAAVKPDPAVDATVVDGYEKSCDAVLATVAAAANLKTKARFAHPWFGWLDASGWHALAGEHMGIHRKQLELILRGLRVAS